jgi:hypothetical protein
MFNSLAALPPYNWLLMTVVNAILPSQINFRVFFVPGVHNIIADHLSCGAMMLHAVSYQD